MVRRSAAALAALVLTGAIAAGCGSASGSSGTSTGPRGSGRGRSARATQGVQSVTLRSGGRRRTYLLYVPPGDSRTHPLPLVLLFHGAGDTASHAVGETDLLGIAQRRHNMILAFPQGYDNTWNEGVGSTPAARAGVNDVAFTAAILRQIEARYWIDPHRVVATGLSNGALLTEWLGCTLSRQLTLIAPVEGQLPVASSARCHPPEPVAVFEVHGTADKSIPYSGGGFIGIGGVPGPTVLSAPDSARRWATLDHCSAPPRSAGSGGVVFTTYARCTDGVTVTLATVEHGGHAWPTGFGPTLANTIAALRTTRTAIP